MTPYASMWVRENRASGLDYLRTAFTMPHRRAFDLERARRYYTAAARVILAEAPIRAVKVKGGSK